MPTEPNDPIEFVEEVREGTQRMGEHSQTSLAPSALMERAEAAHCAAAAIAAEYARIIETYEVATLAQAEVLLDACRKSQELRRAVDSYSVILRRLEVPRDLSLALVRSATKALGTVRRYDRRMFFDDVARWFDDAYSSA